MAITEWMQSNYGLIIIILIFLAIAGYNYYKKRRQKKQNEYSQREDSYMQEPALLEADLLFEDIQGKDNLSTFKKQKQNIEKNLGQVRSKAKNLVNEEKQIDYDYEKHKNQYGMEKKKMGMEYTSWMNQLRIMEEMIQNQARMQEELRKTKR